MNSRLRSNRDSEGYADFTYGNEEKRAIPKDPDLALFTCVQQIAPIKFSSHLYLKVRPRSKT